MIDLTIEWNRWETWIGKKQRPARPDDSWSARHKTWRLHVTPLLSLAFVDGDPRYHWGWEWKVEPKDVHTARSYSGTVPGADSLEAAKHEAWQALKWALASAE